eukprot:TRINITY_DN2949_c0_g1_i1.p1 TRINITY_DN2949_c0_g1~~TRINITY_DN2949_c0_g1_i1.p1  ORF type:complete len:212 (-),score=58.75 TRINITY_DN2949_c0_g1_i1:220-765(-)
MDIPSFSEPLPESAFTKFVANVSRRYQKLLDTVNPWAKSRWGATFFLFIIYCARVYLLSGWFIISYGLGIYLLNLLIGFLSPQVDPEFEDPALLPTTADEEFKPFVRRLPEFKFWVSATRAVALSIFFTFFDAFNVPVFWPILLVYFITLFVATMRKQIQHMIKYKYLPFSWGKRQYKGKM